MEQWRTDYNAAMGAAQAAYAAGNYALAVAYSNQAASLAGTSAAATAATNLRQQAYSANGPGITPAQANSVTGIPSAGSGTGTPTGTTQQSTTDPSASYYDWLKKQQEDAVRKQQDSLIATIREFMAANGMTELLSGIEKYVRLGYSADAAYIMVKNDPAYQAAYAARFAANADRAKAGLAELSPAAYIELEQGYRSAMINRNMPVGLFDSPDDFRTLIARDISVQEVGYRLDRALEYINYSGNAEVKRQLRDLYGMTDGQIAAYVLDPSRTMDYLRNEMDRNMRRASVGGAAVNSGLGITADIRDQIAEVLGSASADEAYATGMSGFANVKEQDALYAKLGDLSGVDTSTNELVSEQFNLSGAGEVTNKKKALASQERARFSGQSGIGSGSLSAGRRAQ